MVKRKVENGEATVLKKPKKESTKEKVEGKFEKKSTSPKKNFKSNGKLGAGKLQEKPEDWNKFKQQKKELKQKRKQGKTGYDVIVQAKKLGEKLRCKAFKGGEVERNKLINELHSLLKEKNHYAKFVLAHDTSRVVQWLLKYSSDIVKRQISQELIPTTLEMLQSKYGIFCLKRLLKYGDTATRIAIIDKMYGNGVKLSSHSLSASVFEYAFSTWASPQQKLHLVQEFFGDIYKNSKDNNIKHIRDIFEQTPDMKVAVLGATKTNLLRVINKSLLDSSLVQTVLNQYLAVCAEVDKSELISLLIPHIVVISNSKDGSRAAMQCIWHGSNKDRKSAMKIIKEHVIALCKHEHGHRTIITLLDTADDTVLLHKIILSEILKGAQELAVNEWGRKVLLWLVAPSDSTFFHKLFITELEEGRVSSNSKKDFTLRRKELLEYSIETLLGLVADDPKFWLGNSSLAYEMAAILKAGTGDIATKAFNAVAQVIVDPEWKIKSNDKEILGIEDGGIHITLKKIIKNEQNIKDAGDCTFNSILVDLISDETVGIWLLLNRGCFVLIAILENSSDAIQAKLKAKIQPHRKILKKQETVGSKILLKKLFVK